MIFSLTLISINFIAKGSKTVGSQKLLLLVVIFATLGIVQASLTLLSLIAKIPHSLAVAYALSDLED